MSPSRLPQQVYPLVLLIVLAAASLIVARSLLIPDTFGKYGHYRGDAEAEIRRQPLVYAGFEACADCHDDLFEVKQTAAHAGLSCEVCHGPGQEHILSEGESLPHIPRTREYCQACHDYNPARPSGFPQILANTHYPAEPCMDCHDPHSPLLERTNECTDCHREIASQKSVSHHASLDCSRCHRVPDNHAGRPLVAVAEKPTENSLCGGCHDRGADSPSSIPRIDITEHSGRYRCWDCHYPHLPEVL
jgi:hypothetical protein